MKHNAPDLPSRSSLCLDPECEQPQGDAVEIRHRGQNLLFGVCAEHARDIDWGVYVPRVADDMRGYIGRAADATDIAG